MQYQRFTNTPEGIEEALTYMTESLESAGLKRKIIMKRVMLAEEALVKLLNNTPERKHFRIGISKFINTCKIKILCKGAEVDFFGEKKYSNIAEMEEEDVYESEEYLQTLILIAKKEFLKYKHKDNYNYVDIIVKKSNHQDLYAIFGSIVGSMAIAFLMQLLLPENICEYFVQNILEPAKTIYLNAMSIIVGPVVFFSIAASVMSFENFSSLGKIGGKVLGLYVFTSIVAVFMGTLAADVFFRGDYSMLAIKNFESHMFTDGAHISIKDIIVNLVPGNFLAPFLDNNIVQVIFLAILVGIAITKTGSKAQAVTNFVNSFNELFVIIANIMASFTPVIIVISLLSLILQSIAGTVPVLFWILAVGIMALAMMVLVYCLMMLVICRTNPFILLRKYLSPALTIFSMSSSTAAIPLNMKFCEEKLGIHQKVSSFSIPLGATINMDGSSVFSAIITLFFCRVYGVDLSISDYVSLFATILLLSMATPGISGSAAINYVTYFKLLNIPMDAIGVAIVLSALMDLFITVSNTTGDVFCSFIAAKTENLVDMNKFYKK